MVKSEKIPETLVGEEPNDIEWFRQNIPCQNTCPAHTDVSNFIGLVAQGQFNEAYLLNRRDNLFPGILGRICAKPCESNCRRGLHDEPLPICTLKRSSADFKTGNLLPKMPAVTRAERVAVVGAGPAGLSCARDLREKGYLTTVYDMLPEPGGMLVGGIPAWRLPREVLKEEVDRYMDALGVVFQLNTRVGKDVSLRSLLNKFNAVFLAAGCQKPTRLALPGETLKGFEYGLDWLEKVNFNRLKETAEGKRVVVIGAGFTAMDCARTALRLGAASVEVCYRRTIEEAPISRNELEEGKNEGVKFNYLVSPVEVLGDAEGRVISLKLVCNRLGQPDENGRKFPQPILGSEFVIPCDLILSATGQVSDTSWLSELPGLGFNKNGSLKINPHTWMTEAKGLFAGGDFTNGPRNVISAIADGHKAASAIHRYFSGEQGEESSEITVIEGWQRNRDYENLKHQPLPVLDLVMCLGADALHCEVQPGYNREDSIVEASRCLQCLYNIIIDPELCILCGACQEVCPDNAIWIGSQEELAETGEDLNFLLDTSLAGTLTISLDENKCLRCGSCLECCPTQAIQITRLSYATSKEHWFTSQKGLAAPLPK